MHSSSRRTARSCGSSICRAGASSGSTRWAASWCRRSRSTMRGAAAKSSGTCATATTSSWRPACTSSTSRLRTGSRRPAGLRSSTSRNSAREGAIPMMRLFRTFALVLTTLPMAVAALPAQVSVPADNTAYGTTSGEFLLLGANARGLALSPAYAALVTDVSALYYNPAGLAQLDRPGALLSTYSYVVNTRYTWAGVAFPFGGGARAFGVQLGNFGFSDQPIYTPDQPDGTGGTYSVSQTFVGLSYAQNFSDRFSAGLTAKYISDRLAAVSGRAFAVDFGTSFHARAAGRPIR